jgi:hypothetical protein
MALDGKQGRTFTMEGNTYPYKPTLTLGTIHNNTLLCLLCNRQTTTYYGGNINKKSAGSTSMEPNPANQFIVKSAYKFLNDPNTPTPIFKRYGRYIYHLRSRCFYGQYYTIRYKRHKIFEEKDGHQSRNVSCVTHT